MEKADKTVLEYQQRLRNAAVELSLVAERERRIIAGEVHDNVSQELAIAKLRLSQLCDEAQGELFTSLDEIRTCISNALQSCRELTYNLATPSLYKLGLIPAVKNLVADFRGRHQLQIEEHFAKYDTPLPPTTEIILYRTIREMLLNIVKHAQANKVAISISVSKNYIRIAITDDGVGFDAEGVLGESSIKNGLGLFLVRERLRHIGGSLELKSIIGKGTAVSLRAPLASAKHRLEQAE